MIVRYATSKWVILILEDETHVTHQCDLENWNVVFLFYSSIPILNYSNLQRQTICVSFFPDFSLSIRVSRLWLTIINYPLVTEYRFSIVKSYILICRFFLWNLWIWLERTQGSSEWVKTVKHRVFPLICYFKYFG